MRRAAARQGVGMDVRDYEIRRHALFFTDAGARALYRQNARQALLRGNTVNGRLYRRYSRYRVCAFPTQKPALMPVQETGTAEQPPRTTGNNSNTALAPGRLVPASALLGMHPRGHARCIADN